ncbi:hypothetical protein SASPL_113009 [Salvia splendens]|uniref:Uncharacterized protein n=1 Tax=Salvia splendens TaxID=180675 RepID=A0A8X8Y1X9_SALSN|nr:hypothetical protein SASPL_113009 [Salvia splendens]
MDSSRLTENRKMLLVCRNRIRQTWVTRGTGEAETLIPILETGDRATPLKAC